MKTYREIIAWKKSMKLVKNIYRLTDSLPKDEKFGLISQIRRAAVSIPSNIAEGFGRRSDKSFLNFLSIAVGSLYELKTQIEICYELSYINKSNFKLINDDLEEVERLLIGFTSKIRRDVKNEK